MTARPFRLRDALPFWMALGLVPLAALAVLRGGAWWVALPAYAWWITSMLDAALGRRRDNPDPEMPESHLFWHRLPTLIWFPIQFALIFGAIWWVTRSDATLGQRLGIFFGVGVVSGTVGIVYAHELLHQRNRLERWLGDLLLGSVLYSHFRSEHTLVHHSWVGTVRDAVTARYNEGFHRFFPRVLRDSPGSAWRAEVARLRRAGRGAFDRRNPFWRYAAIQAVMLGLALALGGWAGLGLFLWQAFVAIWLLELTNYVEHYGLTRRHLGEGRYEPVRPHHSWNADHTASNWMLINLQRHADHHVKPDRRYPLLQTYAEDQAPQLPMGYPGMTVMAMIPPLWRRRMNPRVRAWRKRHYPDITDWTAYNKGTLPMPKNAA